MKKQGLLICLLIAPLFLGFNNNIKNSSLEIETIEIPNTGEKVVTLKESFKPSDPYYTGGSTISGSYQNIALNHIGNIEKVWDTYKGTGVKVAIIDSGIDINHPDFFDKDSNSRIDPLSAAFTYNTSTKKVSSQVGTQYIYHDLEGEKYRSHGTCVAGVALATHNKKGIAGIAPEATILALKTDGYSPCTISAIKYAVDNGAKVINISSGFYAAKYKPDAVEGKDYFPGTENVMTESLKYAYDNNVIVVAAGGNDNTGVHTFPAANNHVIGVGYLAENSSTQKAANSNTNLSTEHAGDDCNVDIVAPGYVITTQYNGKSTYAKISGSSFASPIVAGAAALWRQKRPTAPVSQFEADLFSSTVDLGEKGWDTTFGYGALDIYALLTDFDVDTHNVKLDLGCTHQITTSKGSGAEITYTSDNPEVATVSSTGLISAVAKGSTTINVTYKGDTKKISVSVSDHYPPKKGCGGEIQTTSIILSLVSISFISLLIIKRKRIEN